MLDQVICIEKMVEYHYMIRNNDDVEGVLPQNHKNGTTPATVTQHFKGSNNGVFLGQCHKRYPWG